jgi:hypothetical protein
MVVTQRNTEGFGSAGRAVIYPVPKKKNLKRILGEYIMEYVDN